MGKNAESLAVELLSNLKKNRENFILGESWLSDIKYFIPTGCWPLDATIGGGIPGGRLVELYGDESTGKSLVGLNIIANAQAMGGIALLLDPEMTTEMGFAKKLGVDVDNLIVAYPNTMEDVFQQIKDFISAKVLLDKEKGETIPAIILWDSIASTSSEKELEGVETSGLGKIDVAPHARDMSKMLRILTRQFSTAAVTGVFINQTREKIGTLYGEKQSTFGGKALKFYASVRIKLAVSIAAYKEKTEEGTDVVGVEAISTIVKNKISRPFGKCRFPIIFERGIDNAISCLWFLKEIGAITMTGSWCNIQFSTGAEKFQQSSWPEIFENHKNEIYTIIMQRGVILADEKELTEEDL